MQDGVLERRPDAAATAAEGRVRLPEGPVAATSRRLARNPTLAALLGRAPFWSPTLRAGRLVGSLPPGTDAALGWGRRPSGDRARRLATEAGVPALLVEDGFLRSVLRGDAPLSLVFDDRGIFYDAAAPSAIEALIRRPLGAAETGRAEALAALWRGERLSKYNGAREFGGRLPERYVLVVDQVAGDASIRHGHADAGSFNRMLRAALDAHPGVAVVLKTHPDAARRRRAGHFDLGAVARETRVRVVAEPCHPTRLLEAAEAVYTVTSQMGFEALIWGRPVRTFGMPFYGGWGLTEDALAPPPRRGPVPLAQLVHAALAEYPRYLDPETGAPCAPEVAMAHAGLQRRMRSRFPPVVHAVGFSRLKRPALRRFLAGSEIVFHRSTVGIPEGATAAIWGRPASPPAGTRALLRVEDGFLRSAGLGADLVRPLSWAIDDLGIHYDAGAASRLEAILREAAFPPALLARARALRERLVAAAVTKYNLGGAPWTRPAGAARVVLVPGQVEADAALRFGPGPVRTNHALLAAARAARPGAFIVFKPHPDVVAGLRRAGADEARAADLADAVVREGDTLALIEAADEVHTMTSLTGFEALIRGRRVTCHGAPFYAGWGLTEDCVALPHRGRRLPLDALVAGALIVYPTYVSRVTGRFTSPERAVDELVAWRAASGGARPPGARALRILLRAWAATLRRGA